MKRAVSVSLGSSQRDKRVVVEFEGQPISIERIGTDGDIQRAARLFSELDGTVEALGVGGVDLYLRLDDRQYPLHAAHKLIAGVRQTPLVDGRGLKHTLERRVFELAPLPERPRYQQAFVPVAIDRLGLAQAVSEVCDRVVYGDLMVALEVPIAIGSLKAFRRVARLLLPLVSHFPMRMLFYGSGGSESQPRYARFWRAADLLAGDFLFMRKYMPLDLQGKTVVTNTTTPDNLNLLGERGVKLVITTTPQYEGRSFGTNMLEAALTAFAGLGRALSDDELNQLIDRLGLRPAVHLLN